MINYAIANFILCVTFAIGVTALAVFSFLIMLRFFRDRRKKIRQKHKEEMKRKIFLYLNNPVEDLRRSLTKCRFEVSVLVEFADELLRNLKGKSYVSLLEIFSDAGVYDYIKYKLFSKNRKKYASVINISSHLAGDEIKQRLIDLLEDESDSIRYSAAESLAYTHDIELLPIIIKKFAEEKTLSHLMIANIFDIFGEKVVTEMVALIKNKKTPDRLQKAALLVLAKHSNAKEIAEVVPFLCSDKNDDLRASAFLALADTKVETDIKLLEKGKKDKSWQVRQNVARCAIYNFPLSAKILADLLKDKNWLVALQAAKSMIAAGLQGRKLLDLIAEKKSFDGARARIILAEEGSHAS